MKWHPFSEVVIDATSKFSKIKTSDYHVQGKYKIIDQGKELIAGYTDDTSLINKQLRPVLVFGDHTRALKYLDEPIALGADGAKALWVNEELANPKYVYYYLRSIQIKEAGYSRHFKFLKEVEIPIPFMHGKPNLDDQIRIAHLLSKVEALIAQRKYQLQQLDDLLKSVFVDMFGDPVRNEKGWMKESIGAFTQVGTGGTPSRQKLIEYYSGSIPWVKTTEVQNCEIFRTEEHITENALRETNCSLYPIGTILLAMYGQGRTRGQVGYLRVEAATNQACAAILPSSQNQTFIFQQVRFLYDFIRALGRGGNQENLNLSLVRSIELLLPPIEIQNQFEVIVKKIEGLKLSFQMSLDELESLYGTLSQQAFNGKSTI